MRSSRKWPLLGFIFALGLVASCTPGDIPTEAGLTPAQETQPQFSTIGVTNDLFASAALLSCEPQKYLSNTVVVGSKGGKIKVGTHILSIPAGALSRDVAITAEQITGTVNSVRFSPEGLTFDQPAELTMGYDNCVAVAPAKRIAYTSERLGILQLLRSVDKAQTKVVTSPIDHFSRYAVAY